jgi:hypothetical protein
MMDDGRRTGEPLPASVTPRVKRGKVAKLPNNAEPRMSIHPYTIALGLGKQIRFAAPLEKISAELDQAIRAAIGSGV